jgi:hypothetical protein
MYDCTRRLHFLTFGAGFENPGAARRLARQAQSTHLFNTVSCIAGEDIFSKWPEFSRHKPFIEANPRGWGYWLWKPFIIKEHLKQLRPDEGLVYFDAGCEILSWNRASLSKILSHLNTHDNILWSYQGYCALNLIFWTKQNLLDRAQKEFGLANLLELPGVWAGSIGLTKTTNNLALVDDWFRLATEDNYALLDSTPSPTPQQHRFFDHRHDQSILSVLAAAYGIDGYGCAADYEFGAEHVERWPVLLDKPFLAMRNRTATSIVERMQKSIKLRIKKRIKELVHVSDFCRGWTHVRASDLHQTYKDEFVQLGLLASSETDRDRTAGFDISFRRYGLPKSTT